MAALQKGDLVLVTGATGFIGANVAEEALAAGLNVRATSRSQEKADKLKSIFEEKYGADRFSVAIVPDMFAPNAFHEAIQGVKGVAHVASVLTFSDKWDEVVEPSVQGVRAALEAAASEPSVRRFVLTSSSCAMGMPDADKAQTWTKETWNDASIAGAKESPNGWNVYAASKALAERAAWDFQAEHKPNFKITSVNPNANLGRSHPAASTQSTNGWLFNLANKGDANQLKNITPQHFVNVVDVARLHIAALIREDVGNERIPAFTSAISWGELADAAAKAKPDSAVPKERSEDWWSKKDQTVVKDRRMWEILGQNNVADLETSARQALLGENPHPAAYIKA